jgi:hypothetical protein
MRYSRYINIFVLLVLLACSGDNVPEGILSKKQMVPIIVDIHLSEAINTQRYNISMIRDSLPEDLYLSICKKFKLDRTVIEKSLHYYGKHTQDYIPIYEEVLNVLSEMDAKAKSDTLRPVQLGGFDLDTTKANGSPTPSANDNSQVK